VATLDAVVQASTFAGLVMAFMPDVRCARSRVVSLRTIIVTDIRQ
jgi:hypothetical protein